MSDTGIARHESLASVAAHFGRRYSGTDHHQRALLDVLAGGQSQHTRTVHVSSSFRGVFFILRKTTHKHIHTQPAETNHVFIVRVRFSIAIKMQRRKKKIEKTFLTVEFL